MTYRKLFLTFLTGSTLAVAALWTWSCWGHAQVGYAPWSRGGSYLAAIWSGTLILELDSPEVRPTEAEADAVPFIRHFFRPGFSPHDWSFSWTSSSDLASRFYQYRRTGEFDMEKKFHSIVMGHSSLHHAAAYRLDFPLWVPWLVMVGSAFAVTRWMERRAEGVKEKKLADASGGGENDTSTR
ncbi:MAG: hypothetical protein EOP88_12540 [Verrucomicrobiaceae bacterium]|nr:MAG: hypothetical protein EOP88_12540 [Verrucomicrobiaceae bacterium]